MPDDQFPGVAIEDASPVGMSIAGVSTGTAAFVGPTRKGPVASPDRLPTLLGSYADFERLYGGLSDLALSVTRPGDARPVNYLAHAARAYFSEGGSRLYVARVYQAVPGISGVASSAELGPGGEQGIRFVARDPGGGGPGASLAVETREQVAAAAVDALASAPPGSVVRTGAGDAARPWVYFVKRADGWQALSDSGEAVPGVMPQLPAAAGAASLITLALTVADADGARLDFDGLGWHPDHPQYIGRVLSAATDEPPEISHCPVVLQLGSAVNPRRLLDALVPAASGLAGLPAGSRQGRFMLSGGYDGCMPEAVAYGQALESLTLLDDVSLVAAPGASSFVGRTAIAQALVAHAEAPGRYRLAVLDTDAGLLPAAVRDVRATIDSPHAALYYPWVIVADPRGSTGAGVLSKELALPPSGFLCGILARSDLARGVAKSAANEVVRGALRFERDLSAGEQEQLNLLGINCLRYLPGRGFRVWGARTLSSDPQAKYITVRRYLNYVEASLDRSTQGVVFEPQGEALWLRVREAIQSFLFNEWRQGALLGDKPEQAYFVRCDRTTMTQADIDRGRLICLVGVAPVRPAEFIIFRIGQWTADARP